MLLTADLQLDDNPENEYRWKALRDATDYLSSRSSFGILGDLTDNSNRFSNYLVNRIVDELTAVRDCGTEVMVLMGNHDKAKEGPPYWSFLNRIPGIYYIHEPLRNGPELWLPFSEDPATEWASLNWSGVEVCFLHQTVVGSSVRGREVEVKKPFSLPKGPKYYAGDIHEPQTVGDVVYVGAPSPTDYGDDYLCRFLKISDKNYAIKQEIPLDTIKKMSVTIRDISDLNKLDALRPDDRVKIKFELEAADASLAPSIEQAMVSWAETKKVRAQTFFQMLRVVEGVDVETVEYATADDVLIAFAKQEGIGGGLLDAGKRIVERANKAR